MGDGDQERLHGTWLKVFDIGRLYVGGSWEEGCGDHVP